MAECLDDGEFWLPPQFLADDDDDIFMETKKTAPDFFNYPNVKPGLDSDSEFVKSMFPFELPCYGFGSSSSLSSFGLCSDVSSPVESVMGSTETESDEEDSLAGLTRHMANSTLDDDFTYNTHVFATQNSKGRVLSVSPQSSLCAVGSGCGCRQRSSSHGSPKGLLPQVTSPQPTWDLLYAAAGEVARMSNCHSNGLLVPPRNPSPVSAPLRNTNPDVALYHKLQLSQFQHLKQQQMMKQQSNSGVLGSSQPTVVHNRGRNNNGAPLGLSASAWPSLQQAHQKPNGSDMRAVFLGNPGVKRESTGTGVFLPRRSGAPSEPRKKSAACSTVLLPARVVQALNLNLDEIGGQPQFQPRFNGGYSLDIDTAMKLRNNGTTHSNQKRGLRPQPGMKNEVRLPQEWTY